MKLAIISSRSLTINNLEDYIPENTVEIISGGAKGIDSCAKMFALKHSLKYTEFLPKYNLYGRAAPLRRNLEIISYADMVSPPVSYIPSYACFAYLSISQYPTHSKPPMVSSPEFPFHLGREFQTQQFLYLW